MMNVDKIIDYFSAFEGNISRAEIMKKGRDFGMEDKAIFQFINSLTRVGRGMYSTDPNAKASSPKPTTAKKPQSLEFKTAPVDFKTKSKGSSSDRTADVVAVSMDDSVYIPEKDPTFVPWGNYTTIKKIIKSGHFFPTYISGLSGNGKSLQVQQACAETSREYVRVQITPETDEDDLLGGFRLVSGETVFEKGPLIKAMEHGAILLIDECDRGSNKLMCLQGALEGKPILLKKINKIVEPAPGFNIIATANTNGRGSEDGRYTAATLIDDAFLERFVATFEQDYPSMAVETKILLRHLDYFGFDSTEEANLKFVNKLVCWGHIIRKTFEDGGVEDFIATRRLCHILKAMAVIENEHKAVELCTNRFDIDTRMAFLDLWEKIGTGEAKVETEENS